MFSKKVLMAVALSLGLSTSAILAQSQTRPHGPKSKPPVVKQSRKPKGLQSGREPILAVDSPNASNGQTVYGIVAGAPGIITYPVPNFTLTLTEVTGSGRHKRIQLSLQPTTPVGTTAAQDVFQIVVQIPAGVGVHHYILSGSTNTGVVFTPVAINTNDSMRKTKKHK